MSGVKAMLDECAKHIGTGEPNKFQSWYKSRNGNAFAGNFPWCDAFITYCAVKSGNYGVVCHGKDYAYTVAHAQRFKDAGEWHAGTEANVGAAKPGDIVFFDWGKSDSIRAIDHVGIVTKNLGNGNVETIEGNTSNKCLRKTRNHADIAGYGRPKYSGSPAPAPKPASDTIRPGDSGAAVRKLQSDLNKLNYGLTVDGEYGPKTRAAVDAFKKRRGLPTDGVWGEGAQAALKAALAPKPAPTKPPVVDPPAPQPAPKPVPAPAPKPSTPVGNDAVLSALSGLGARVAAYQATIDELTRVVVFLAQNEADLDTAQLVADIHAAIKEYVK